MLAISPQELASIAQEAVSAACDQACVIKRNTLIKDAWGTETETPVTVATTVAGLTQPSASLLANYDFLIGSLATYHVKLPNNTDVQRLDTLIIGGQEMQVQVVLTPQSYSIFTNCLAAKVKG